MKNNKNAISFMTLRILPLSDEDKQFITSEQLSAYKNTVEYANLMKCISEFKNSYKLAPLVSRFFIKDSYKEELKHNCDALRHIVDKSKEKEIDISK